MNFPSRHPLNQSEPQPRAGRRRRRDSRPRAHRFLGHGERVSRPAGAHVRGRLRKRAPSSISITAGDLYIKSNYQDFERYPEVDIAMAADAEATLPVADRSREAADHAPIARLHFQARGAKLADGAPDRAGASANRRDVRDGTPARSARRGCLPNSGRRSRTKTGRWCRRSQSNWPARLWNFRQALPVHRRLGRRRRRIRRAGGGRRRAREQEIRPADASTSRTTAI